MSRLRIWLHLVLHVTGLAGALIMAVVLIYRTNLRLDLTPEQLFTISSYTKRVVEGIESEVNVVVFTREEDSRNDYFADLLRQVALHQPRIRFRFYDVNRSPAVARQYGATSYGSVIVESEGRRKDFTNMSEELLTAALVHVTSDVQKKVVILTGHGGPDFANADHRNGYSTASTALRNENYLVEMIDIARLTGLPDDTQVLIVAGPKQDLRAPVIDAIDAYLRRGGAMLVLADPGNSPALVDYLARLRIGLPDEVVVDPVQSLSAGEPLTARITELSANSMVTKALESEPMFSYSRPIVELAAGDREVQIHRLLESSKGSWAVFAPRGHTEGDLAYDEARGDRFGPQKLGVEAVIPLEGGEGPSPSDTDAGEAVARPVSRVIVYGDADFANNFFIQYLGNLDLFLNSVNWLAREGGLIGTRPEMKQHGTEQIFVSRRQAYWAFMYAAVVQPGIVAAFGLVVFVWRRLR